MSKRWTIGRVLWLIWAAVVVVVVVGFWFDTDPGGTIAGKYAPAPTLKRVLVLAVGYLAILGGHFLAHPRSIGRGEARRALSVGTRLRYLMLPIAVFAVVGEGVLRASEALDQREAIERRSAGLARYDPYLQAVPVAGDDSLQVNRWGFRGDEIERSKPTGTYRVFVVGGSTVFASRVAFEHSHPARLQTLLRTRYPGRRIEVQNAGMDWHTTRHSVAKILFTIADFEPDLIVGYHAVNDLCRSFTPPGFGRGAYAADYSHYEGPVAPMVREYFESEPRGGFRLLAVVRREFARRWYSDFRAGTDDVDGAGGAGDRGGAGGGTDPEVTVDAWPSLAAFERNLHHLARLVPEIGAELVLASQPSLYRTDLNDEARSTLWFADSICRSAGSRPDVASMMRGMQAFNAATERVAGAYGVPFVDLESAVPKSLEYFVDDVHYTEEGNRLIAETIAAEIIARGLLESDRPPVPSG